MADINATAQEAEGTSTASSAAEDTRWIFGLARGPVEGYLRTLIEGRELLIEDKGHGVRLYPPYAENGPVRMVQPKRGGGRRCSGDGCEKATGGCVHCWEDRFRFGDLKGREFRVPIKVARVINKKTDDAYGSVIRILERPNPTVLMAQGPRKAATVAGWARKKMPRQVPALLVRLARQLRREQERRDILSGVKRGQGRPGVDVWDLAVIAAHRIDNVLPYEALDVEIERFYEGRDGTGPQILQPFKHKRLIEAMNGYSTETDEAKRQEDDVRLSRALEAMRDRIPRYFRNVSTVAMCDGMVLSTAATDSARRGSLTRTRASQVELHVMYDNRWGFVTAWVLTWNARGRGSGESPQLPYLIRRTKALLPGVDILNADMAYGSARNRALMRTLGIKFVCGIKEGQFEGKDLTESLAYLTMDEIQDEKRRNSPANPLFCQLNPFRNRVEGWHEVMRSQSKRNLISRPDRSRYPLTIAQKLKENPNKAEAELPEDQTEREHIIATEQFVGRACYNEMLCREIMMGLRALVRAEVWYETEVDFAFDTPFQPRPEDEEFSVFRPRIDPSLVA